MEASGGDGNHAVLGRRDGHPRGRGARRLCRGVLAGNGGPAAEATPEPEAPDRSAVGGDGQRVLRPARHRLDPKVEEGGRGGKGLGLRTSNGIN